MNKKIEHLKKHVEDNALHYVVGTLTLTALVLLHKNRQLTNEVNRELAALNKLRNKEWKLHEVPPIRDLFKDKSSVLMIGMFDDDLAYKLTED